ncbi:hypothetical protein BS50DRAFT_316221 [Corynespora cassiicola Philippines]|uniref:Secreted protein n=1 Tax=Corynespora cassiicola Philippines TaxID=1448308 RepID=A0A2T2NYQ7_CORCC|nr:hypothetical protein BS50DRAFT_316221 [Corynespora cassiicola Philippines]
MKSIPLLLAGLIFADARHLWRSYAPENKTLAGRNDHLPVPCRPSFLYCGWELIKQGWDPDCLSQKVSSLLGLGDYRKKYVWHTIFLCGSEQVVWPYGVCKQRPCGGPFANCPHDARVEFKYRDRSEPQRNPSPAQVSQTCAGENYHGALDDWEVRDDLFISNSTYINCT